MNRQLALDIGNSRLHWGLFENSNLLQSGFDFPLPHADEIILANVSELSAELEKYLEPRHYIKLTHNTPLPIQLDYHTPETLGVDRIAAAVALHKLFPNQAALSIDIGSCITYDLINDQAVYLGGAISPGAEMRAKAMNHFTARLPLVKAQFPESFIGKSTNTSMASGIMYGISAEIDAMIERTKQLYPKLQVILTGGNASLFVKVLKNHIFADPNLVLIGLNEILLYKRA